MSDTYLKVGSLSSYPFRIDRNVIQFSFQKKIKFLWTRSEINRSISLKYNNLFDNFSADKNMIFYVENVIIGLLHTFLLHPRSLHSGKEKKNFKIS